MPASCPLACSRRSRVFLVGSQRPQVTCQSNFAEALAAKRIPLHTPTQDAVDLPKMVQVVCRFQANELLNRLPSA